uniref:Uncharacterized protein n=1 Tax=Lutzomyia longipalpis TaxID=7200 RepID=A0A1B0GLR3_LUTLO
MSSQQDQVAVKDEPQKDDLHKDQKDEALKDEDAKDESSKELRDKELEELEKGFEETLRSIQTIKDCKEIMGGLQEYILHLLTSNEGDEGFPEDEEEEEEAAVGGHTDTLMGMEKEKLKASKEDATERFEMFKKTLAEGAKETFSYDMSSIDKEIERIKKDFEEMQGGMKLFDEQEKLFEEIKKIKEEEDE